MDVMANSLLLYYHSFGLSFTLIVNSKHIGPYNDLCARCIVAVVFGEWLLCSCSLTHSFASSKLNSREMSLINYFKAHFAILTVSSIHLNICQMCSWWQNVINRFLWGNKLRTFCIGEFLCAQTYCVS